jgi:hypothetical protein
MLPALDQRGISISLREPQEMYAERVRLHDSPERMKRNQTFAEAIANGQHVRDVDVGTVLRRRTNTSN